MLTGVIYGKVVSFDFIVAYDDQFYLLENPLLEKPSLKGLLTLFTSFHVTDYLPLLHTSFYLDHLLWGRNPAGFHLTNLLLHGANGLLLFFFLSKLTRRHRIAFFTALIFLIHPVQVESVAWVPERKNILVLLFLLLSAHFFWFKGRKGVGLVFYGCALLSKSLAVVFPGLVLLSPALFRKKLGIPTIIVSLAMAVTIAIITIVSQSSVGAVKAYHGGSFTASFVLMGQTYWRYLWTLVTGRGLSPLHSVPEINLFLGLGFYGTMAVGLFFLWGCKQRFIMGAVLSFFLFLLPVSNIIPIAVLQADRYLYIQVSIFFLVAFIAWDYFWKRAKIGWPRHGTLLFGLLTCLCYIPATIQYLPVYKNADAMWHRVMEDPKLEGVASYNLGVVHEKRGQIASSLYWYNRAIETTDHCMARNNMGALLLEQGHHEKAHRLFLEAVERCPNDPRLLYNLGLSYLARQESQKGMACLVSVMENEDRAPELAKSARAILHQIDGKRQKKAPANHIHTQH